ncbi:MAG: TetR/AcrR family transcriptional regulator [Candidatus Aminicenantes bacterium]|nr:TetR/AcrR family transcriptional regulator [Candidatus Aminicenantes bacterium]
MSLSKQKTPYHKGGLPDRFLVEAARMIAELGPEALSMRRLSARLGVSRTAAYHHFRNKGELMSAVGRRGFAFLAEGVGEAAAGSSSTSEALTNMVLAYVRFAREKTSFFRLMFADILRRPVKRKDPIELSAFPFSSPEAFETLGQFVFWIKRGQEQGLLQPGEPLLQANVMWAFGHGIAYLLIDNHLKFTGDPETIVRRGMAALIEGFRPGSSRPAEKPSARGPVPSPKKSKETNRQ